MKEIVKRCTPKEFRKFKVGDISFDLREDTENAEVGDLFTCVENNPNVGYTTNSLSCNVRYVLRANETNGLQPGYCIIGFKRRT